MKGEIEKETYGRRYGRGFGRGGRGRGEEVIRGGEGGREREVPSISVAVVSPIAAAFSNHFLASSLLTVTPQNPSAYIFPNFCYNKIKNLLSSLSSLHT